MSSKDWAGETLGGRYQIQEIMGQGGMSAVYKAVDPNLQRIVAVKMIHAHLSSNPEFVQRFESEAAAVAQLRHPNIIQVYDFNQDQGIYYMVLEFIPGETLQARLQRLNDSGRQMPVEEAIKYASQISDAADYAHQRGMIHRDIKPANVMLDINGNAILMDFGIAKMLGGQRHTATGAVIGTALYMSPEQIQGKQIDGRSDIYSIGVTLFEMLNGKPPYQADSAMTLMMMHMNDPVPDLHQLQPNVPPEIVAVVEKSLAKDRDSRYSNAAEFARALQTSFSVSSASPSDQVTEPQIPEAEDTPLEPTQVAGAGIAAAAGSPNEIDYPTVSSPEADIAPAAANNDSSSTPVTTVPVGSQATTAEPTESTTKKSSFNPILIGGIVGALILVSAIAIGLVLFTRSGNGDGTSVALASDSTPTPTEMGDNLAVGDPNPTNTLQPTDTATPTRTPIPTNTSPPTDTPTPTLSPTPTIPPGIPYVLITDITLDGNTYVVEYETFEYTEQLPGMHVHFFFDTVPPEEAGVPGDGPWKLYGGPRPFKQYNIYNRPADATLMCALVANPNHSIQLESGNCFLLPIVEMDSTPTSSTGY